MLVRLVQLAAPPDTPNGLLTTNGNALNWGGIQRRHDLSNGVPSFPCLWD